MSIAMFCKTTEGDLEEVNELVFKCREQVMLNEENRRYTDDYFFVHSSVGIEASGEIGKDDFALLGRRLGFHTTSSKTIKECPEFVFLQQRKGTKQKLMHTKTGQVYKT